ncbi:MAG: Wzz/FepE/Etk N-terminal domain-containing protein [Pseudomonadota bacterium]
MNTEFLYNQKMHVSRTDSIEEENFISMIFSYVRMAWRRKFIIAGTLVVGILMTVFAALLVRPNYTAHTTIMVNTEKPNFIPGQEASVTNVRSDLLINSEIAILQSMPLLKQVVRNMGLLNKPQSHTSTLRKILKRISGYTEPYLGINLVNGDLKLHQDHLSNETKIEQIANRIKNNLSVSLVPKTVLIKIEHRSQDQYFPQNVVNEIANTYIRQQWEARLKSIETASVWLSERISKLQSNLRTSERALQEFKIDNNLVNAGDQTLSEKQFISINEQLILAKAKLQENELRYRQLEKVLNQGQNEAKLTEVVNSETLENLRKSFIDVAKREAELSSQYNSRHPRLIAVRAELNDVNQQIRQEARRVLITAKNEYQVAEVRVQSLEESLSRSLQKTNISKTAAIRLQELQQDVEANRTLYKTFIDRHKEISEQKTLAHSDFRLVSPATSTKASDLTRNRVKVFVVGFVASMMLALGLALLLEKIDSSFRTRRQVELETGLPCLVSMPLLKDEDTQDGNEILPIMDYSVAKPNSLFSNTLSRLSYELDHINPQIQSQIGAKVFMFTSAVPNEGKTLLTLNFARYIALKNSRVLIVDGDLRRASLSEYIIPDNGDSHLIDALQGNVSWQQVLRRDEKIGLDALPCRVGEHDFMRLLSSDNMQRLMAEARASYDYIIIDSPPIMPVPDVFALKEHTDVSAMIVEWGATPMSVVSEAIRSFNSKGHEFSGVVLNKVDMEQIKDYEPFASHYGSYGAMNY